MSSELKNAACGHGLQEDQADGAVKAVLTTLQERLAGGLPEEVLAKVSQDLRRELERGPIRRQEDLERFDLDEFLRRVGEREQVDLPVAVEHARAVTSALCDTLSESTFSGLRVHLPASYDALFAGGSSGDARA